MDGYLQDEYVNFQQKGAPMSFVSTIGRVINYLGRCDVLDDTSDLPG